MTLCCDLKITQPWLVFGRGVANPEKTSTLQAKYFVSKVQNCSKLSKWISQIGVTIGVPFARPAGWGGRQKLDVWSQSSQVNSGIFQRSSECLRKFRRDKNDFWLDEKGPRQHKDPHFDPQKGYKIQQFWHKSPKMPISGAIFEFCATKPRASFSGYKKRPDFENTLWSKVFMLGI